MRWAWVVAALLLPQGATAQLAERVESVEDGRVRFSYATRPGVEVCDQGVRIGDRHMMWRSRGRDMVATNCLEGRAEVELTLRSGSVRDVELVTGQPERSGRLTELGEVSAGAAVDFLLGLAYGDASASGAEAAILPAMVADVDEAWRPLLGLAGDRALEEGLREKALFWLGQAAADAATAGIADIALAAREEQEIRDAAVFALSQRPPEEGVPVLMEVARGADQAETRRTAMFWLAQSDDPRVVAFFEEILLGRSR